MITLSYFCRAAALGFGVFFLANAIVGLLGAAAARWRGFDRMEAREAARLLLALRLLPAIVALVLAAEVVFLGFLAYERQKGGEPVNAWLTLAALAGLVGWSESATRSLRAVVNSRRWRAGILETSDPFLTVAGIRHPRIIASRGFLETTPQPLQEVALRHELAHFESGDNLKRLLVLLMPELLPLVRVGFRNLDSVRMRYVERAADDRAVAGDPERGMLLAEVLVRTARGRVLAPPVLASPLIDAAAELQPRVERLLNLRPAPCGSRYLPGVVFAVLLAMPPTLAAMLPARPLFEWAERFLLHA